MKLGLVGGAYQSGSLPLSAQECINLFPEVSEQDGKEKHSLRPTPGLTSFSSVGSGPIRAMHVFDGTLYAVSQNTLYSIDSAGVETSIGTVGAATSMDDNRAELIVVNGTQGYLYDGTTFSQITDADFPGLDVVHYIDTYFIGNEPGTQRFWSSASADGSSWNALDFASKEGAPGNLSTLNVNHREVILFGAKTYEIWRNTGDTDFQFERQEGLFQERGCGAKFSVQNLDNTVYFLGDDKIVYRIDQYAPVRISNHGVESFLEGIDVSGATSFAYTQRGHYFYVLNVGGVSWVYDATYSLQTGIPSWHKRRTGSGRWRAENYVNVYNKHLVGDYSSGTIWELDLDVYTDNGAEIERTRTLAPRHGDGDPVSFNKIELACETGVGNSDVTDPQVWLEISKDGGRTWSDKLYRSIGKVGEYNKTVAWRGLGWGKDWVFRLSTTEKCKVEWYELYPDVERGVG